MPDPGSPWERENPDEQKWGPENNIALGLVTFIYASRNFDQKKLKEEFRKASDDMEAAYPDYGASFEEFHKLFHLWR